MVDQVAIAPLGCGQLLGAVAQLGIELGVARGDGRLAGELLHQRHVARIDGPRLAVGDGERADDVAAGSHQRRDDDRAKLQPVG